MSDVLLLQEQLRKQVQQQEVRLKARFKYSSGSFQSFCHWMVLVPSWEPAGDANFAKRVGSEDGGVAWDHGQDSSLASNAARGSFWLQKTCFSPTFKAQESSKLKDVSFVQLKCFVVGIFSHFCHSFCLSFTVERTKWRQWIRSWRSQPQSCLGIQYTHLWGRHLLEGFTLITVDHDGLGGRRMDSVSDVKVVKVMWHT